MSRRFWILAGIAAVALFVYLLGPVLTPFMLGAILAYLGSPVVGRLERWRVPRTLGVTIVFAVFFGVAAGALFFIIPPLESQLAHFVQQIPRYVNWLQRHALPALGIHVPEGYLLDAARIKSIVTQHLNEAGGAAAWFAQSATKSGMALISFVVDVLLVPVVTFYLMRDWDVLTEHIRALLPRRSAPTVIRLTREVDETLGAFVRGQLLVMLSLGIFYSVGLWFIGLDLGLLIGMGSGLVNFVPYLGFIVGIVAASVAVLVQTQDVSQLIWVGVVFAIGKALEDMILVPLMVGDRIGLHPVAVIFAILAGGELFGFLGVLLALPVAAALAVLWRYARTRWVQSPAYRGDE